MHVRLGFAVAAHMEPDILVVDEVLAVGDASFQEKAIGKMKEVSNKSGRTVLFVSHNMASISALCSKAILLKKGKLLNKGNPHEIIQEYLKGNVQDYPIIDKKKINELKEEKLFAGFPFIEIDEISIEDKDKKNRLDFQSNEEIYFKIKFRCSKEIDNLRFQLHIALSSGQHILSSLVTDDDRMKDATKLYKGSYIWKCKIPSNFFGTNHYLMGLHVILHGVQHLILENVFRVKVNFIGYNNILKVSGENSPMKPKLEWTKL